MSTFAKIKSLFDYEILETFETGIVLAGTEVKSVKAGKISIKESFVKILSNEIWLVNSHVAEYEQANRFNHNPTRSRKLLMKRRDIDRLIGRIKEAGLTLVPISVYQKKRLVKVEIALAKGKKTHDKRNTIRERDLQREMGRDIKLK
ncbi:SsrA-binding protein SmpB [Seleniivibrio sp.]|uniref:SsrA-binding protein SmpB n=1 Tax=Seleniivibrio sp. TaxID=2898801 RepID=UPI0025FC465F|nr:SsrA-binding protein SmpB [Seleniivibrio sp.]MCD8554955.1 SsrA-binding protein SmpB [Seleniivibrio sp.]